MVAHNTKAQAQPELKALAHGLDALRVLIEARVPLTSTQIARKIGLHQSSASRILRALMEAGYVRKPNYQSFTIDYGVCTLSADADAHFPLARAPREALKKIAAQANGLMVTLATLWRGQLIYLLRAQEGHEMIGLSSGGFPLHLSSVALRLLIDQPRAVAIEALELSSQRYGWERPTDNVPLSPEECLLAAQRAVRSECLTLANWQSPGSISAAVPVNIPGHPQAALAIAGPSRLLAQERMAVLLRDGRDAVVSAVCAHAAAE